MRCAYCSVLANERGIRQTECSSKRTTGSVTTGMCDGGRQIQCSVVSSVPVGTYSHRYGCVCGSNVRYTYSMYDTLIECMVVHIIGSLGRSGSLLVLGTCSRYTCGGKDCEWYTGCSHWLGCPSQISVAVW